MKSLNACSGYLIFETLNLKISSESSVLEKSKNIHLRKSFFMRILIASGFVCY
jgi:hypothetical protein